MIKDVAEKVLIEHQGRKLIFPRLCVNLDGLPLKDFESPLTNRNLRFTNFKDYFKYQPSVKRSQKDRPFLLMTDLAPNRCIRFGSWEELINMEEIKKEVSWLLKFTEMRPELLEIAEQNIQIPIYINMDVYAYDKYLRDMVEKETGVRPDYSMLKPKAFSEADIQRFEDWMKNKGKIIYK